MYFLSKAMLWEFSTLSVDSVFAFARSILELTALRS